MKAICADFVGIKINQKKYFDSKIKKIFFGL